MKGGLLAAFYFLIAAGVLVNYGVNAFKDMFTPGGFFIPWTVGPILGILAFVLGVVALLYALVAVFGFVWESFGGVRTYITQTLHVNGKNHTRH